MSIKLFSYLQECRGSLGQFLEIVDVKVFKLHMSL